MEIVFPLQSRTLTLDCAGHIAQGRGCASDFKANYEEGCSPVSGKVFLFHESGGGDWMRITDELGRKWEMAHLSQRFFSTPYIIKAGQRAFVTGGRVGEHHSGQTTSGPHLHLQVKDKKGVRLDPWPLLINAPLFMSNEMYNDKIIRNKNSGGFALVVKGKKFVFPREMGVLGLLTFLQRNTEVNFRNQIVNVDDAVWDSIPISTDLSFN